MQLIETTQIIHAYNISNWMIRFQLRLDLIRSLLDLEVRQDIGCPCWDITQLTCHTSKDETLNKNGWTKLIIMCKIIGEERYEDWKRKERKRMEMEWMAYWKVKEANHESVRSMAQNRKYILEIVVNTCGERITVVLNIHKNYLVSLFLHCKYGNKHTLGKSIDQLISHQ
jgi:hypothetical protein